MLEGDKEKGKRGSLCELWFTCVVGSSEYAFRHFWSCSLAHSAFLSSVLPFPFSCPMCLNALNSEPGSYFPLRSKLNMLTLADLFYASGAQDAREKAAW